MQKSVVVGTITGMYFLQKVWLLVYVWIQVFFQMFLASVWKSQTFRTGNIVTWKLGTLGSHMRTGLGARSTARRRAWQWQHWDQTGTGNRNLVGTVIAEAPQGNFNISQWFHGNFQNYCWRLLRWLPKSRTFLFGKGWANYSSIY